MTKFNIVYLPLDERPCNYHFAQRIAMGTEVHLRKPSPEVLGDKKIPAELAITITQRSTMIRPVYFL